MLLLLSQPRWKQKTSKVKRRMGWQSDSGTATVELFSPHSPLDSVMPSGGRVGGMNPSRMSSPLLLTKESFHLLSIC